MADRPIIFSAPMVRALLAGTKTQTRRVLKPQPHNKRDLSWCSWRIASSYRTTKADPPGVEAVKPWPNASAPTATEIVGAGYRIIARPGDRLWVRESLKVTSNDQGARWLTYAADGSDVIQLRPWVKDRNSVPSIHMERGSSRLTLTVTDVRVQRLQDISEDDARAEGCPFTHDGRQYDPPAPDVDSWQGYGRASFCLLWDNINGAGSWEANPWVAAHTFTVEKRNIDA